MIMPLNVKKRIANIYPSLGYQSKIVVDYILQKGTNFISKTVKQIAEECNVSTATVSRLAQQLGYANLSQLKWSVANELDEQYVVSEIQDDDSPKTVAKKTLQSNIESLNNTFELMDESDLSKAVKLITNAHTLGFFGLGGSNIAALDAYHKFLRVPINCIHDSEYHMSLMQAARMSNNDCAIIISHTGDDTDTLLLADTLQSKTVPMIVITSFPESPLADYGDVKFFSISEDSRYRSEALLSLTSQVAINDCLYALTAQHFGPQAYKVLEDIRTTIFSKHKNAKN